MHTHRVLYLMSISGGIAGLIAWVLATMLLSLFSGIRGAGASELLSGLLLGALIGAFVIGFADHFDTGTTRASWILSGSGLGAVGGVIAVALFLLFSPALQKASQPILARMLLWILAGTLIGGAIGLRSWEVNRLRVLHASLGGFVGGMIGGATFQIPIQSNGDLLQAIGYVIVGIGIAGGISMAPVVARQGILRYLHSDNEKVRAVLGRLRKEWTIQNGDSLTLGSAPQDKVGTVFLRSVDIFIPDPAIAPLQATLWASRGAFYIDPHSSVRAAERLARFPIFVNQRRITDTQLLSEGAEIRMGATIFRFSQRVSST